MFKRRHALAWMNVDDGAFAEWAVSYLAARGHIPRGYLSISEAIRSFQQAFLSRPPADDANDEKLVRNLKQAWTKHLKRKASRGRQKPYSFEMDVRVHAKLKDLAKSSGQPIYQVLETLILDSSKVLDELRRQKREETERQLGRLASKDQSTERRAKQAQALKAKVTLWEQAADRMAYDNARYWVALKGAGLASGGQDPVLTPDQKADVETLHKTLIATAKKEVDANLGLLRAESPLFS